MNASPFTPELNNSRSIVIIVLVVLACFLPTLNNGFVDWDDENNYTKNYEYRGLSLKHLTWMFTSSINTGLYMPLTWVSLGFDYLLWGMNPAGYHLTNLLIHACNSILFFYLVLMLIHRYSGIAETAGLLSLRMGAIAGTLFFAIHPLRVESVAWLTQRRDVLSALFYLLTVMAYFKTQLSDKESIYREKWFYLSLLWFTCSLLSKPWAITLPVIFIILDVYPLKRMTFEKPLGKLKKGVCNKIPYFLIAFAFVALTAQAQQTLGATQSMAQHGMLARFMQAAYSLCFYLWKTILPFRLSPLYLLKPGFNPFSIRYIVCAIIVVLICTVLIRFRHRWPWAITAWACYAAVLTPVLGFFQSGPELVADRYSYLSCLPFSLLIGVGVSRLWPVPGKTRPKRVFVGAAAVAAAGYFIALSILTHHQIRIWKDSDTLWQHVLALDADNHVAHNNLGNNLLKAGRLKEAVKHYSKALKLRPGLWIAHINLGTAYKNLGNTKKALSQYQRAIQIKPEAADAYFNAGNVLSLQGKIEQAMAQYAKTLQINPDHASTHNNLGILKARQGKLKEALDHFHQALQSRPDFEDARINMTRILEIIETAKQSSP